MRLMKQCSEFLVLESFAEERLLHYFIVNKELVLYNTEGKKGAGRGVLEFGVSGSCLLASSVTAMVLIISMSIN